MVNSYRTETRKVQFPPCVLLHFADRVEVYVCCQQSEKHAGRRLGAAQCCCQTACPSSPLPLSHSSQTVEEEDGHRTQEIFPAGARTPPWAHERPNLFFVFTGYMLGNLVHQRSVHRSFILGRAQVHPRTFFTSLTTHTHDAQLARSARSGAHDAANIYRSQRLPLLSPTTRTRPHTHATTHTSRFIG